MMRKKMFLVALLAGLIALAMPMAALADFALTIQGQGGTVYPLVTIVDNGPGDLNPAINDIVVIPGVSVGVPAIPGITGSLDSAITNTPGGPSFSLVDLNWSLSSVGGGTGASILVETSANNFTFPATGLPAKLTSSIGGTITGDVSVEAAQAVNLDNALFGSGINTPTQGPFVSSIFSDTESVSFTSDTPFAITDALLLDVGSDSLTTGDLESKVTTPEPGLLILLGIDLSAIGLFSRRIKL